MVPLIPAPLPIADEPLLLLQAALGVKVQGLRFQRLAAKLEAMLALTAPAEAMHCRLVGTRNS